MKLPDFLSIEKFEYGQAVTATKALAAGWKRKTVELAQILYNASLALSDSGYRSDLTSGQLASSEQLNEAKPFHTFQDFCEAIDMPYRTAKRYVSLYNPEANTLLTEDELKAKKAVELDTLFEKVRATRKKLAGWKPSFDDIAKALYWNKNIVAWTERVEALYQDWLCQKGYLTITPSLGRELPEPNVLDQYGQYGLFSAGYLEELVSTCQRNTMGEGAIQYTKMVNTYKKRIPEGVEVNKVMRVPVLVEASLEGLTPEQKSETAKLLSEIILRLGE